MWHKKGDHARAIEAYDEVFAMHDAQPMLSQTGVIYAYNNRGVSHFDSGEFDQAIADFDKAIAGEAKFTTAYFNRGRAHNAKGDRDAAIMDFSKAIELTPNFEMACVNRAAAYRTKGDYDAATDYARVLNINPKNSEAASDLGKAYVESMKASVGRLWKGIFGG